MGYRLCVCASGSVITDILNCFTLTKFSFLHFGQNNGNFISSVSYRILIRVLFPQTGQYSHSSIMYLSPPMFFFFLFGIIASSGLSIDQIDDVILPFHYKIDMILIMSCLGFC